MRELLFSFTEYFGNEEAQIQATHGQLDFLKKLYEDCMHNCAR